MKRIFKTSRKKDSSCTRGKKKPKISSQAIFSSETWRSESNERKCSKC